MERLPTCKEMLDQYAKYVPFKQRHPKRFGLCLANLPTPPPPPPLENLLMVKYVGVWLPRTLKVSVGSGKSTGEATLGLSWASGLQAKRTSLILNILCLSVSD
jgi:hypothetical protein